MAVLFYGYSNPNGYFSNFAKFAIRIDAVAIVYNNKEVAYNSKEVAYNSKEVHKIARTFSCNEQYIMWQKAVMFGDWETAHLILRQSRPTKMKELGKLVKNFDPEVWIAAIDEIADRCNLAKFTQHEELKEKLLATENNLLAEASPSDRIWGIGLSRDSPHAQNPRKWRGQNKLGESLMRIRTILRNAENARC